MPRRLVRRRQRLGVEELRQLVVLLGEAGLAIELCLEAQHVTAERLEEVLGEIRPARGVDGAGGDSAAAKPLDAHDHLHRRRHLCCD